MNRKQKIRNTALLTALAASAMVMAACGGHSGHGSSHEDEGLRIEGGDALSGRPYRVTLTGATELSASMGTVSKINPVTQEEAGENEWFYVVPAAYFAGYDLDYEEVKSLSVTFRAISGDGKISEYQQQLKITDPLLADQWHLYNIGQDPFSVDLDPVARIDINVIPAWRTILEDRKAQVDGSGVLIAIYDTPIDLNHEDLKGQLHDPGIAGSEKFINAGITLADLKEDDVNAHGTGVAGIVASSGLNGLGGRGVAFNARLTSFSNNDLNEPTVLGYMLQTEGLKAVNASWGLDLMTYSNPSVADLYEALYEEDIAVFHSQGNEFDEDDSPDKPHILGECSDLKVDCEYKQTNEIARQPFVIQVGSLNSLGVKASYGSTGANLWVTGFGGEFGYEGSYSSDSSAAIVTTLSSFADGWDDWDEGTPWRTADNSFYTSKMNGTSSATPSVTGAAALAYQANPGLTVSQLRYLLATTSRTDKDMPTLALETAASDDDGVYHERIVYDHGWQENGAGLRFANRYGFGVVDAHALVDGALGCSEDPVCVKMADLPEVFVSSNSTPCTYADSTQMSVKCSFSGFRDPEDEETTLENATLTIDAVTYDVAGLGYLPEGAEGYCADTASELTETRRAAVFKANNRLQITAASQAGIIDALIKPVYTNWDINAGAGADNQELLDLIGDLEGGVQNSPLEIATSTFYLETITEDPDRHFTLSFKSRCKLDLESLNRHMKMKVYGRR